MGEEPTVIRIREAALTEFANRGVAGATMKCIADKAGVSAQLVVHHFGSKQGVAAACDEYVVAMFRERNTSLMESGGAFSREKRLKEPWVGPALAYFAARLTDNSAAVADIVDDLVEDAMTYFDKGEDSGLLKPSSHPRERVIIVLLWHLGALTLHRHAQRLLGVDLLAGDADDLKTWSEISSEMLTDGLFNKEAMEKMMETEKPERQESRDE